MHRLVRQICLGCVLLAAVGLFAQKKNDNNIQQSPTFKARTQLVLVPAVVIKGGNPVRGLTKDNFVIEDDGKQVPITVFEPVQTQNKRVVAPSRMGEFTNINSDSTPRAMTLVAIDAINTPFGYQEAVRKDVLKYLAKNVSPNQLVGLIIMTQKGVRIVHDFTSDTALLTAALQKVSGENNRYNAARDVANQAHASTEVTALDSRGEAAIPTAPGATQPPVGFNSGEGSVHDGTQMMAFITRSLQSYLRGEDKVEEFGLKSRVRLTLETFQQIAQGLAGYPGRKSLIWCSASFPAPLQPDRFNDMELMSTYERTLKLLADANVVVYPVDVKGLQIINPGADATLSPYDRAAGVDTNSAYKDASLKVDTFREFADRTGGRVYFDINNNQKAFEDAAEDSEAYYMLGYYLEANSSVGWHKLKVKMRNADGKVHTRSGYFYTAATSDPAVSRKQDLTVGTRSPFDYTSLTMTVRAAREEPGATSKKKLSFSMDVSAPNLVAVDENNLLDMDFVAVARKADTTVAGQASQSVKSNLKPEAVEFIKSKGISKNITIELEPGSYEIRFLVRDNTTGRMGSVLAPVTVN